MKVILNKCYGGFGFSNEAYMLYAKKKGFRAYPYIQVHDCGQSVLKRLTAEEALTKESIWIRFLKKDYGEHIRMNEINSEDMFYLGDEKREDPVAIEVVEELGSRANDRFAELVIVDIPDGMIYEIDDYDGIETLHEKVRCW